MLIYHLRITIPLRSEGDAVSLGPLSCFLGHVQRYLLASPTTAKENNILKAMSLNI